jgi:hypothetical protein
MIPADVLGAVERNVASTCFGGNKHKQKWGGIPIILFLGDDYQLPPVQIMGKGKGAFHALDYKPSSFKKGISVELHGMEEFLRLSKGVMILDSNKRIQQDQENFRDILNRVRIGKPTEKDKETLLSLLFSRLPSNIREMYDNSCDSLHLFATKDMCSEYNFKKLRENNNNDNPVAFLKHKLPRHLCDCSNDNNTIPQITCFSRGCKVSIKGKNFCPLLGLYNGAIGTVHEIVYKKGESPNTGNLPLYVAVNFPGYLGRMQGYGNMIWDKTMPTVIPIPIIKTVDEKTKRNIEYCPLSLSFARTIHTYQGQSAGPTNDKCNNPIQRIICDVGTTRFESQNIGLFYTALSRATTIGTEEKNRTDSAIYFTQSLDKQRLDRLITKSNNTQYDMIEKRDRWTRLLMKNIIEEDMNIPDKRVKEIFDWASTTNVPVSMIEHAV